MTSVLNQTIAHVKVGNTVVSKKNLPLKFIMIFDSLVVIFDSDSLTKVITALHFMDESKI